MAKPFRGAVDVDVTESVPDWKPYTQSIAPEGTASVLYAGGTIHKAIIDVSGTPFVDLANEVRMAFARD